MSTSSKAATTYAARQSPFATTFADLSGDAAVDGIDDNRFDDVSILLDSANGRFEPPTKFKARANHVGTATADEDVDDRPDIVVAESSGGAAMVLKAASLNPIPSSGTPAIASAAAAPLVSPAPHVIGIAVSAVGPLRLGQSVTLTLTLDQAVAVSQGVPALMLSNGSIATYSGGSGTTALTFAYTAAAAQSTPDLKVVGLSLNGAMVAMPASFALAPVATYSAGTNLRSLTTADLNGDGKPDAIVADTNAGVIVLFGNGSGGFGAAAMTYSAGSYADSVTTADVNGDGQLDLVVADLFGNVSVRLGQRGVGGSFSLGAATSYGVGTAPDSLKAIDVNGDGKVDLLVATESSGLAVLLGNGSGGFGAAASYAAGTTPVSLATADVNGDGKLDAIVADLYGGIDVLLGNGSGGFGTATTYAAGVNPHSVTTADVNGDGRPDLIVADDVGRVAVLLANGSGGFRTAMTYAALANPGDVTTADLNGDGKLDLIVTSAGNPGVVVLLGDGSGGFGMAIPFGEPIGQSVTTADVNGDGLPDIVAADYNGTVSVLTNVSTFVPLLASSVPTAPGADTGLAVITTSVLDDFNADGKSDLLLQNDNGAIVIETTNSLTVSGGGLINSPGPTYHVVGAADFNGDGQNDILLQNDNGAVVDYLMNGPAITAGNLLTNPGPTWHVRGTGDFNNDGKADIVLQNDNGYILVEYTDGTNIIGGGFVSNPGPSWTVEGVADFNGDGQPDILLQNTNGTIVDFLLNGTAVAAGYQLLGPNVGYSVAGTGNYNGDNRADVLLHNDNGTNVVLYTNGQATIGTNAPIGNPGPSWATAVGGADYNGDGSSDLLIENTTGTLVGYTLNSSGAITASNTITNPGAGWRVAGDPPIQFIDGTGSAATLAGTPGVDEFNFTSFTPGIHTVTNFDAAIDLIALSAAAIGGYANLQPHESLYNGGTAIGLSATAALVIQGVTPDQLTSANFVFR